MRQPKRSEVQGIYDDYDFGGKYAQTYSNECENCGFRISISTQEDDFFEYYSTIFVKCPNCSKSIPFTLPVN